MSSNFLSVGMNGVVQVNGTAVANLRMHLSALKTIMLRNMFAEALILATSIVGSDQSARRNQG